MLIRRMKPLGYSLEQMGDLLRALESSRAADASGIDGEVALSGFLADAQERRAKLAKQLDAADEFIGLLNAQIAK